VEEYDFVAAGSNKSFVDALAASADEAYNYKNYNNLNHV